jgi:proteasome activator subunit 4
LSWFASALTSYQTYGIASYLQQIILCILEMLDYSEQDLSNMAVQVLKIFPNFLQDPIQLEGVLHTLSELCKKTSSDTNWHVKTRVLPVIQVLYFRHLYLLSGTSRKEIMDLLYILIRDPQVEVRKLASITLSGLVQCSERKEIESMIAKFRKLVADSHLPKRKSSEPVTPSYSELLSKRHAGILGLCSLVLAFPYDVPGWMPSILVELAQSSTGPSPISVLLG